jgi:hypothetical protein
MGIVLNRASCSGTSAIVRVGAIGLLAGLLAPTVLNGRAAAADPGRSTVGVDLSRPGLGAAEHRYRIVGKLRLALFWVSRDDVGSARMSWQSDGTTIALTLLLGSDPQRAPRGLNQWGYLREEVRRDLTDVFSLRSVDRDGDDPSGGFSVGDGPEFGVSCAAVGDDEVSSRQTRVNARGVTYRMFDQLLDRISASPHWEQRHMPRPSGAAPGFLTAIQQAIRLGETAAGDRGVKKLRPVTYVYNSAVYDLTIQGRESLGRTTVGTRTFERLIRTELSIRNRTTTDVTKFGLTYSPDDGPAPLPVQIFYQPSFWLRIELRLDDNADVPVDPAADGAMLNRIRALCAP